MMSKSLQKRNTCFEKKSRPVNLATPFSKFSCHCKPAIERIILTWVVHALLRVFSVCLSHLSMPKIVGICNKIGFQV